MPPDPGPKRVHFQQSVPLGFYEQLAKFERTEDPRKVNSGGTTPGDTEASQTLGDLTKSPAVPKVGNLVLTPKHPAFKVKLIREMDQLGTEVSVTKFMKEFFPKPPRTCPTKLQWAETVGIDYDGLQLYDESGEARDEFSMYPILCKQWNRICQHAGVPFEFRDVASWSEDTVSDMRPDLVLYPTDSPFEEAWTLDAEKVEKAAEERRPYAARCAWAHMTLIVEVKRTEGDAGFCFSDKGFLRDSDVGRTARAQFSTYDAEALLRQQRTHLFMIYITNDWARLFRFDRAGYVASEAFNIFEKPHFLNNFIWRFVQQTPQQMGYDETVTFASDDEIELVRKYQPTGPGHLFLHMYRKVMLERPKIYPIYKVSCQTIPDDDEEKSSPPRYKTLLFGKCHFYHYSPTGRATRGYVAYDVDEDRLCFLKDQWRPKNAPGSHPEIDTYRHLKEHDVQHVATAIAGGDVEGPSGVQCTLAQKYLKAEHGDKRSMPVERIHYRLVLRQVGRPLEDYGDSMVLLNVCTHALIGHQEAWEKAGILHRDISVGNILIDVETEEGFLNDWDLCKWVADLVTLDASQPAGISGTWPFLSAVSLLYPLKPSDLADDLEAFVYVVLYCALRWHKHGDTPFVKANASPDAKIIANNNNTAFARKIDALFYEDTLAVKGCYSAGETKLEKIMSGKPPIDLADQTSPLAILLGKLYDLLKKHYEGINFKALENKRLHGSNNESTPAPAPAPAKQVAKEKTPRIFNPFRRKVPKVKAHPGTLDTKDVSDADKAASSTSPPRNLPLDSHQAILAIFEGAFADESDGAFWDTSVFVNDKLWDQYEGLLTFPGTRTRGLTGARGARRTSVKRSADDAGVGAQVTVPSKQRKNVVLRDHGRSFRVPMVTESERAAAAAAVEAAAAAAAEEAAAAAAEPAVDDPPVNAPAGEDAEPAVEQVAAADPPPPPVTRESSGHTPIVGTMVLRRRKKKPQAK